MTSPATTQPWTPRVGESVVVASIDDLPFYDHSALHPSGDRVVKVGDVLKVENVMTIRTSTPHQKTNWVGEVVFWRLDVNKPTGATHKDGTSLGMLPLSCVKRLDDMPVEPSPSAKECRCPARSLLFGHEKGCDYA